MARGLATQTKVVQRYQHGIEVSFSGSQASEFGFFDASTIVPMVAIVLLYIGVLPAIIKVIAVYLLGSTSRTYKRAVEESLRVEESCSRTFPATMLHTAAVFLILSTIDSKMVVNKEEYDRAMVGYIKPSTIAFLITHCLREEKSLQSSELETINKVIYDALGGDDNKVSLSEFMRAVTSEMIFD